MLPIKTRYVGLGSIAIMQIGQFLGGSGICDPNFVSGLTNLDLMSIFAGVLTLADWIQARLKEREGKSELLELSEAI